MSRILATAEAEEGRVEARVEIPGEGSHLVQWLLPGQPITGGDFLLPLVLLVAMRVGMDLRLDAEVSTRMLANVGRIQELYRSWDSSLDLVEVDCADQASRRPRSDAADIGSFFSGGVDSFHTALVHRQELTALVHVQGFDIRHDRRQLLDRVRVASEAAASGLGLRLLVVRTDVRSFSHRYLTWAEFHGAAMAATAHILGLRRCYVPSSLSTGNALPYGSHPDLDPMWSSEATELVYDGYEVNRLEKTRLVARSGTALRYLRVCNTRDDSGYNCGRCEKCLRTMIGLRVWGHAGPLPTFPAPLDLGDVATRRTQRDPELWVQNLEGLRRIGTDRALIAALERSLTRPRGRPPTGGGTGSAERPDPT